MPIITWNKPYAWISQDDIVASPGQIIEGKNIDWLRTGFGWTLWPKPVKQILTSNTPMRAIDGSRSSNWNPDYTYTVGDWGNIYRLGYPDNSPVHTLAWWENIVNWQTFITWSIYYFMKNTWNDHYNLCSNWIWYADSDNWVDDLNESVHTGMYCPYTPPMYVTWTFIYIGYSNHILRIDTSWTQTVFNMFNRYVVGITQHWTQFYVYSSNWKLSLWDWVSTSVSANLDLWFRIRKTEQKAWIDYVTSEKGDLYIMSGYTAQLISEVTQSDRLEDNSQYISKKNFKTWEYTSKALIFTWNDLMLASNDTQVGIYKYWDLIPWIAKSFHKVLTNNNTSNNLDEIYALEYVEPINTLYYSYKQWTTYWIDKIELNNLTTAQDWYFITDVIRGLPNEENQVIKLKMLTSYTSWDNYIKLSKRVNNGVWEEVRTINNATDTIDMEEINTESDNWFEFQLKVEIHNELQTEFPPILHEMSLEFDKTN